MMEQDNKELNTPISRINYAGRYGLLVGGMWIVAFICSMYSIRNPFIGITGNTVALLSLYVLFIIVVRYRAFIAPLSFSGCFTVAWFTCLFAGLITTLGQYLYFCFLDKGRFMGTITELLSSDQYAQMMKQAAPGIDPKEMTKLLDNIHMNDLIFGMLQFNFLLSIPMALIAAIFGRLKNVERFNRPNEKN